MGGLEVDFLLQIKEGLFAYSDFSFLGETWALCEWCPCEGRGWNGALGVNVGKGSCAGKGVEAFHLPLGSPACRNVGALSQRHLNLHPVSLRGFCWLHLPEERNDGRDLLGNRSGCCHFVYLHHLCFWIAWALWHHVSSVVYLPISLWKGRKGQGEQHRGGEVNGDCQRF